MSVGGKANAGGRERVHLGFKDEFCLLVMGKSFNLRMAEGKLLSNRAPGQAALWGKSGDASPNCPSLPLFVWLRSVRGCTLCPRWPKLLRPGAWTASESPGRFGAQLLPSFTDVPARLSTKPRARAASTLHFTGSCKFRLLQLSC